MLTVIVFSTDLLLLAAFEQSFNRRNIAMKSVSTHSEALEALWTYRCDFVVVDAYTDFEDRLAFIESLRLHESNQTLPVLVIGEIDSDVNFRAYHAGGDMVVGRAEAVEEICRTADWHWRS